MNEYKSIWRFFIDGNNSIDYLAGDAIESDCKWNNRDAHNQVNIIGNKK